MAQLPSWERRPSIGGVMPANMALAEAASQTFKKGDFLTIDSNGRVVQTLSAGSSLGATTATINNTAARVIGQADQDASGVTGALVQVVPLKGVQFLLPVYSATPASAIASTAQIGKSYELIYVNSDIDHFAVNLDATTNIKLQVVDMLPGAGGQNLYADLGVGTGNYANVDFKGYSTAAGTDQYAYVWVEFLANYSLGMGGSYS